ncbi:MAG: proton-conducting transporter membrane subunit, partial [Aphanizomenon sp.]
MLSVLIWLPMIAATIIGFYPAKDVPSNRIRLASLTVTGLVLLWNIFILLKFDISNPGMQFTEYLPWNETLGLSYHLGVDGLSILMLVLNSFLTWIAIYSSSKDTERPRLFYSLILFVSGGVAGAFLSQNLLLFFLFYELELIPFYLLISIWGGKNRAYAGMKFLIYTAISGALILATFLGMVWLGGSHSFAFDTVATANISAGMQLILLAGIVLGFGIKIPLIPFHTWLPD